MLAVAIGQGLEHGRSCPHDMTVFLQTLIWVVGPATWYNEHARPAFLLVDVRAKIRLVTTSRPLTVPI